MREGWILVRSLDKYSFNVDSQNSIIILVGIRQKNMNETKLLERLIVLPCRLNDVGSQRCSLPTSVMSKWHILLYDVIKIQCTDGCSVLCRAWPRMDNGDEYMQFDGTVVSTADDYWHCDQESKCTGRLSLPLENIKKVNYSVVESLSVTVVVTNWKEFMLQRNGSVDMLQCLLQNLLIGFVIAADHIMLCSRTSLGKLYCWDRIIFHHVIVKSGCSCGFITDRCKITIKKIISKDRFTHCTQIPAVLGGLDHEINLLCGIVQQSQKYGLPDSSCPKQGVLVTGPSGCGKTSLVKLIARQCDAYLVRVGENVHGARPGDSEQNLRAAFLRATTACVEGPCILFFDDLDTFCPRCHDDSDALARRMLAELLTLMEKQKDLPQLMVIAATNKPSRIDPCLRRIGRFNKEVLLGIPDESRRCDILKVIVPQKALADDVKLHSLAQATPGFTGAGLSSLMRFAMAQALERWASSDNKKQEVHINPADLFVALHHVRPSSQHGSDLFITSMQHISWNDIGGLEDVKQRLKQCVEWPLKYPEAYTSLGLRLPRGILLHGPPGCAKTSLVRAAASSCHVNFLTISGAQLYSPYLGEAEKKIAEVFHQARACAPSILFIDEIDSVIGSRAAEGGMKGSGGEAVQQRVLSTLLNEMDGIGILADDVQQPSQCKIAVGAGECPEIPELTKTTVDNLSVLVIAATNRIDMVDAALLRPGRMDHVIYVPPPDFEGRLEILKVYTRQKPTINLSLEDIASQTDGFTGADLENLCNEASLYAVKADGFECQCVTDNHFRDVLKWLKPSLTSKELQSYQMQKDSFKLHI